MAIYHCFECDNDIDLDYDAEHIERCPYMTNKSNTGINNTGENNSGDFNSGYRNSGDRNSGNWNSGYFNSGNGNSGNWNSGNWNSGYGNSTKRSAGIFNSEEGKVRMFNKETDLTWDEISHPHFVEFWLNKWVEEDEMTEEEKIANPDFSINKGYLKTFEWEEAWANFWRNTDEENRQKFLNLPNFDAEVFKSITGIDVTKESVDDKMEEAMELLRSRGYKIVKK